MSNVSVLLRFDAKQTDHGLVMTNPDGVDLNEGLRTGTKPVAEWPEHLFVPRLFYLWALKAEISKGDWVMATVGKLEFYLADGWATYELAHTVQGGGHWDLLDSGPGV